MKVVDLLNARPVLESVANRKMPAKLAYAIAKNYRLIGSEIEVYDKVRLKLLSDNWKLNEETGRYDIPDNEQPKWNQMIDELVQTESGYQPYKIDLSFAEQVEWSPSELLLLWFIFEGEGSEDLAPLNGSN